MKKIFAVLLSVSLLFTLACCGQKPEEPTTEEQTTVAEAPSGNDVTALMEEGYSITSAMADETVWKGVLQNANAPEKLYFGTAPLTSELYTAYSAIEFDDAEGMKAFLAGLENVTLTDISDKIPSQEEMDQYVGRTLGELEDDGFENTGYSNDEGAVIFSYDGPAYSCNVTPTEGTVIENMDDWSANDLRELTIGKMEYTGISSALINNLGAEQEDGSEA